MGEPILQSTEIDMSVNQGNDVILSCMVTNMNTKTYMVHSLAFRDWFDTRYIHITGT